MARNLAPWDPAKGHDGNPFTWLGALGGLAYMAAIGFMRLHG